MNLILSEILGFIIFGLTIISFVISTALLIYLKTNKPKIDEDINENFKNNDSEKYNNNYEENYNNDENNGPIKEK